MIYFSSLRADHRYVRFARRWKALVARSRKTREMLKSRAKGKSGLSQWPEPVQKSTEESRDARLLASLLRLHVLGNKYGNAAWIIHHDLEKSAARLPWRFTKPCSALILLGLHSGRHSQSRWALAVARPAPGAIPCSMDSGSGGGFTNPHAGRRFDCGFPRRACVCKLLRSVSLSVGARGAYRRAVYSL